MAFQRHLIAPVELAQAIAEHCDWSAVATCLAGSFSAQECESVFRSIFASARNSAPVPVSKSEITVTELPEQIKQEPVQASKPKSAPKPPQQFTLVDANRKRVRRKATQIKRLFRCIVSSCSRSYGTEGALKMHLKLKHPDVTYDPMNPPVVYETVSIMNGKHRHEEDEDDQSTSSSIDDLNASPPSTPLSSLPTGAPQSPTSGYDFSKPLPRPAGLPQINSLLPSTYVPQQSMFNTGFPHMMPPMYAPHPGFPMSSPWATPAMATQPLPMTMNFPDTKKRASPEMDSQLASQPKRLKTAEVDVLSTLVSLKSQ